MTSSAYTNGNLAANSMIINASASNINFYIDQTYEYAWATSSGSTHTTRVGIDQNRLRLYTGFLQFADISEPSTPASGNGVAYVNTDSLRFKNDAGTVFTLGRSTGSSGWSLSGNSITAGTDFLGTTNNTSLRIYANNTQALVVV